jgi:diguanylate cyclase (GGDEF)-like protein
VDDSRKRAGVGLAGRELWATLAAGLGFAGTAAALALAFRGGTMPSWWVVVLLVGTYAILSQVEFELGPGTVVPTELVLVPMLFLVRPAAVPILVALGFSVGALPDLVLRHVHAERILVRLSYSWHAIGPALVFAVAKPGPPSWHDAPIYLLALAAQFGLDLATSLALEWLGAGVSPAVLVSALARAYLVDLLLAPIGLLAAFTAAGEPLGFLPVLSLALLLALLAADRRERIGETIELTDAYENASTVARADALTGVANRRAWQEHLAGLELAQRRDGRAVSIVIVDLDGLKLANDSHGHAFGDALIRASARVVEAVVGSAGFVARLDGDEFGIAVECSGAECALLLARLEAAVQGHPGLDGFPLSFSVGAGSSPPEATLAAAFAEADRRMYARKRAAGRTRIA